MSKYKTLYEEELRAVLGGTGDEPVKLKCKPAGHEFYSNVEYKDEQSTEKDGGSIIRLYKCPVCNEFVEWTAADIGAIGININYPQQ